MMNIPLLLGKYLDPTNFNASNITNDWFYIPFAGYVSVLGALFYAVILLAPALSMYMQSDRNAFQTALVLAVVGCFFGAIIPNAITTIIFIIIGGVFALLLYEKVTEKKRPW